MEKETLGNEKLTAFSGFVSSGNYYSYHQALAQLISAICVLRKSKKLEREIGMFPDNLGRSRITDDGDFVWDYLRMRGGEEGKHTENPNLTLGAERWYVSALVTFSNKLRTPVRKNLDNYAREGLKKMLNNILRNMDGVLSRTPEAQPIARVFQRRYPNLRLPPIDDAQLDFDLRTISDNSEKPKHQPQWIDAVIDVFFFGKNSNLQLQVGVFFEYRNCPTMSKSVAIRSIEDAWVACKPIIDVALEGVR